MPNRDQSGPMGRGPLTGRGMGVCNRQNRRKRRGGRMAATAGLGLGLGLAARKRHRFQEDLNDSDVERLERRRQNLQAQLEAVNNQIESL